jgi:uncharacterized protein (TIGR02145 family)
LYDATVWSSATEKVNLIADDAPEPLLFLPAGGIRNYYDGNVGSTGTNGHYWSSVVEDESSYRMQLLMSSVTVFDVGSRASGLSVRCIAE